MQKFAVGLAVLLSAAVLGAGCAGDDATAGVTVETKEMQFTPKTISVAPGHQVISVHNVGELRHTFSINALGEEVTVNPGETKTLEVDVEAGSTYRYVCRVLDHEGLGMRGTLRVRDN